MNCCSVGLYACFRPENVAIESQSLRYPHFHLDAVKTTLTVSLLLTSFYSTCFCTFFFFATLNFDYAQACTYERLSASFVAFIESKRKFAHVRVVWSSFFVLFAQNFSRTNGLRHFRRVGTGSTCTKRHGQLVSLPRKWTCIQVWSPGIRDVVRFDMCKTWSQITLPVVSKSWGDHLVVCIVTGPS